MQTVSVHEAKTHLSRLLKEVAMGKEIIITSSGRPVGRLAAPMASHKKRVADIFKRKIRIPANFDDPMPDKWFEADDFPQARLKQRRKKR